MGGYSFPSVAIVLAGGVLKGELVVVLGAILGENKSPSLLGILDLDDRLIGGGGGGIMLRDAFRE